LKLCLLLGGLFAAEANFLRAPYEGDLDDKQDNEEFSSLPTNGSHMQLTYGRNRKPQSEL